jgi:hypothetical protein
VVNSVSKPAREPLLLASWMRKALRTLVIINGAFAGGLLAKPEHQVRLPSSLTARSGFQAG